MSTEETKSKLFVIATLVVIVFFIFALLYAGTTSFSSSTNKQEPENINKIVVPENFTPSLEDTRGELLRAIEEARASNQKPLLTAEQIEQLAEHLAKIQILMNEFFEAVERERKEKNIKIPEDYPGKGIPKRSDTKDWPDYILLPVEKDAKEKLLRDGTRGGVFVQKIFCESCT